jgi:hypothetical protein
VVRREPVHAVARRDVREARVEERERVDEGFAEDDLAVLGDGLDVEDSVMRPGKIEVVRRSGPEVRRDLAPVHLEHVALFVDDRDHHRSVEVLVSTLLAQDAEALESRADLVARLAVLVGQAQAQRSVGEPDPVPLDDLGGGDTAALEVREGLRALLERVVVVVDDLLEQLLVVGGERDRSG